MQSNANHSILKQFCGMVRSGLEPHKIYYVVESTKILTLSNEPARIPNSSMKVFNVHHVAWITMRFKSQEVNAKQSPGSLK